MWEHRSKSSKALLEEIDDATNEAQGIIDKAADEGRTPSVAEARRFDEITDRTIPDLRNQLNEVHRRESKLIELSRQNRGQSMNHPSGTIYNQSNFVGDRVLPTNGIPAGDGDRPRYSNFHRVGKLRAIPRRTIGVRFGHVVQGRSGPCGQRHD